MHRLKIRLLFAVALAVALPMAPASAQEIVQQVDPEADRLAEDMKLLAADPRNVTALVSAGRGALAMGDPNGALSFFLRAQEVSPTHGPAKAGMASALVELERPGEALRLFEEATRYGVRDADIAADRGLAYDLVGDQARAQRDYATALASKSDDEVTRRYALSLGISNQRDAALTLLDPLIRKQDRGAWRSRAFILAMTGDESGAAKIADQTLPPTMARMLRPYFDKLEDLNGGERAFAVHYGHLGGDAARVAKAAAPAASGAVIATRTAAPPRTAAQGASAWSLPLASAARQPAAQRDSGRAIPVGRVQSVTTPGPTQAPARTPVPPVRTAVPAPTPTRVAATPAPVPARTVVAALTPTPVPTAIAALPVTPPAANANRVVASYGPPASAATQPPAITPKPMPTPVRIASVTPAAIAPSVSSPAARTSLLASIIAGIDIPEAELAARPAASLDEVARMQAEERRVARATRAREAAAAKKAADAKALAVAAAAKKKTDAAAAAAKKAAPERHWVQIATGANPAALARDFKKMVVRAPVLKGQDAWSARFGGTRRMLVGPFKSQGEAVAFMSKAKAGGISGFNWTSPEGAEVEKLPAI